MHISLFTRERDGLRLNPYIEIGSFSLAIDGDGFLVIMRRRSFGYIRKAGWHYSRHGEPQ